MDIAKKIVNLFLQQKINKINYIFSYSELKEFFLFVYDNYPYIKSPILNIEVSKNKKICFIGDLHGGLKEFNKIYFSHIDYNTFIIIGDILDRRNKCVELFIIILALIIVKKNIYFIRGNHEDEFVQNNKYNTFSFDHFYKKRFENVTNINYIYKLFGIFPLSINLLINNGKNRIFILHGGLINSLINFKKIEDYSKIKMRQNTDDIDIYRLKYVTPLYQILWNDVGPNFDGDFSNNGSRSYFGKKMTNDFFIENKNLSLIIKGHSHMICNNDGYNLCHDNKVLTLISFICKKFGKNEYASIATLENENELYIKSFKLNKHNKFKKIKIVLF